MALIDFILNIAGLLLWLGWRSARLDPLARATPATLVGTIRRTEPNRLRRWNLVMFLGVLIVLRAYLYRALGPAVGWSPQLNLGAIVLVFRTTEYSNQLIFSALSFGRLFVIFHFWLLLLTSVNRRSASPDPLQKLIALQLGKTAQWPSWIQITSPIVLAGFLWLSCHPLLVRFGIISPVSSGLHLVGQCLVISAGLLLSLKYLLPFVFAMHLVSSYVYFGASPLWDFVSSSSRNLLKPLFGDSMRFGKLDVAPVLGVAIAIFVFFFPGPWLFRYVLNRWELTIWPG